MTKVTIFLEKTDSKQAFLIQNVFGFSWKESQMVKMKFSSLLLTLGGVTLQINLPLPEKAFLMKLSSWYFFKGKLHFPKTAACTFYSLHEPGLSVNEANLISGRAPSDGDK